MSKLFYDLLYSLKEVAKMENCPEVVKEIDEIIKNGLNEVCPENGQRSAVACPYPDRKGDCSDHCKKEKM